MARQEQSAAQEHEEHYEKELEAAQLDSGADYAGELPDEPLDVLPSYRSPLPHHARSR